MKPTKQNYNIYKRRTAFINKEEKKYAKLAGRKPKVRKIIPFNKWKKHFA